MTMFTDKVADQCNIEFARFKNGRGRETKDPFAGFVGEYWSIGVKNHHIDGRTTFQDARGRSYRPAWSSAFVSYIMRKSGAGDQFFYHEGHVHYVVKAIRDSQMSGTTAKFLGRDPAAYAPKVGDLINAGRGTGADARFTNILRKYGKKPVPDGDFVPSHTDIVVEIDQGKRTLATIGGNVEVDTVGKKTWNLKKDGTLLKGPSLVCVIECLL